MNGNDRLSHFTPMGFLAVAGCMLLATAMSAALSSKPSKA
ncbi:putative membrane protein [Synechococcus sp. M16.1]|nr:putative membrane protein [Synechococcus sp. M16.1]